MKKYWIYLKYILRHKWFVFKAGLKLGVNPIQLILHDWSKFLPDEFIAYAEWFNGYKIVDKNARRLGYWIHEHRSWYEAPESFEKAKRKQAFDRAWLKHQHRNPHHWQHWLLREDDGDLKVLEMPYKYRREMLADWIGAGLAITGKMEVWTWYERTKEHRLLHKYDQNWIEANIAELKREYEQKEKVAA